MDDELLARHPALVGVVLAGEDERRLDLLAVDLHGRGVGVLLDDREDVGEQAALELGEVRALDRRVDARATASTGARRAPVDDPLARRGPHAAFAVTSLRNVRPSS